MPESQSSPSSSSSRQETEDSERDSQPLIPGLPDEIGELCLLHVPYPYQALVRTVSSSWNKAITDRTFYICKKSLSLAMPYVFVFSFHKSTARIQWQALDPGSGRWFILPPMPCPKDVFPPAFACTSLPHQGKLFVLGGMRSDIEIPMNSTMIYSTSTNQWSLASPMPTARSFFASGNVKGKIMAVGGSENINEPFTSVECYDSENDTWMAAAKLRMGLTRFDSVVVGTKMYVTEGWTWPFMFSPRGGVYDIVKDTWQLMNDGMKEGWTGISFVVEDKLFVISEHGDCPMKLYNPENDMWQYVGGDKFPREAMQRPFAVNGVEGRIYVVSSKLNVAIGRVFVEQNGQISVEWKVMAAPKAFNELAPLSCQVLYA